MSDRNKEIFDEVQAQINVDAQKNEEYFARMAQCIKRNQNFVKDMQALNRRNNSVWKQLGIDFDECRTSHQNPFLSLAKEHPENFSKMSEWVEKSRKEANKEVEAYGFNFQEMGSEKTKQSFFGSVLNTTTKGGIVGSKNKKFVRRVRI